MKVAYNILHKLGTKQEPMVRPGDRVSVEMVYKKPVYVFRQYDARYKVIKSNVEKMCFLITKEMVR